MTCTDQKTMTDYYSVDKIVDEWGGYVERTIKLTNTDKVILNIHTPWGDDHNNITILDGESKKYTSGLLEYIVNVHQITYNSSIDAYVFYVSLCYEFTEKLNTITSLTYDEISGTREGQKVILNVTLTNEQGAAIDQAVKMYLNDNPITNVFPPASFEHVISSEDVGKTLKFQAKFGGLEGFNASESSIVEVDIPVADGYLKQYNFLFRDQNNVTIIESLPGKTVHARLDVVNMGTVQDTFRVIMKISDTDVYDNIFDLGAGAIKQNLITSSWIMPDNDVLLTITLYHLNQNGVYDIDNYYEKVLEYSEPSCIPNWQCEVPLSGYEIDGCGNRRTNADCELCVPDWKCEIPLNGYEEDGCGNRRTNADCELCVPDWKCEIPLNEYEEDGCGNRRYNADCEPCVPDWKCEIPLNGYEEDGCGNRRYNADCEPCVPDWKCEIPLNGYEADGCGNRRYNADCEPCVPDWKCEIPLNGYEADGCGNRRTNPVCEPCIPNWQCEVPLNGYEADGCGNRRLNSACGPCIPNWQCEVPLNGYEADGCGNRRYNADCEPYIPLEEELIEEPSYIIPIVIGAGVITAVGLFILSRKK